jgi:hypothetical protein
MVTVSGYTPIIINSINPAKINIYPNYLWVYMHHHITAQVIEFLIMFIYFSKHELLRQNLRQAGLEAVQFIKQILHL